MRTMWLCAPVLCLAAFGSGPDLSYTLLPPGGLAPTGRFDGAMAYDPAEEQVFLFGGQDTQPRNDLWAYSLRRSQWREVAVQSGRPAPRFGHTLLFDPVRRRLVVFGGQGGGFFSDVWAFDLASGSWQQLSPDEAGPKRRYGHSAIYEPGRDRMVISHGFTDAGRFDDTWEFDLSRNAWRDLSPAGTRPLRRCLHHAVLDPERSEMLLYGGCASGFGPCPLGDLWSFDLKTNRWTERVGAVKPPAREHYGIVFDTVRGVMVVFGGSGGSLLNDTWEFDPRNATWREAALDGPPPGRRSRHESVFAADRGAAFFFGGSTETGALSNELWMLRPPDLPRLTAESVVNAFSGDGAPIAPGEVVSIFGRGLGPRDGVTFQFDPASGLLPGSGAGVAVTWNGIPSPLYYASAGQVNVQVPYELNGLREVSLVVTVSGRASAPVVLPVAPVRPGLLREAWNQDGLLNTQSNRARAGDIVVFYATGQGVTQPPSRTGSAPQGGYPEPVATTTLNIGDLPAEILFRGQAPGTAGVMQINARIPTGVSPGNAVPVTLAVGAGQSRTTIAIQ